MQHCQLPIVFDVHHVSEKNAILRMLLEEFKSCFNGVNKMDSNIKIFEHLLYIENTFECKI